MWTGSGVKGLGFGGTTWHDVGGVRSFNATYTNSYKYPIAVSAVGDQYGAYLYGAVDGQYVAYSDLHSRTIGWWASVLFIVPPGSTYSVYGSSNQGSGPVPGLVSWKELY